MENILIEKSTLLSYPHGFSTRFGGVSNGIYESLNLGMNRGDDKEKVIENWHRFLDAANIPVKDFVCGAQVHGNHVHIASAKDMRPAYGPGILIEADGYVTNEKNVPLSIFTADCVPLLLEDSQNKVVGAIHSGWRSTALDIEKEAVEKMLSIGAKTSCIHAAIGPAIDQCCFEVGKEVVDAMNSLLGDASNFYEYKTDSDKYMLDLRGVVKERLIQLGLKKENIELVGGCTMCNHDKYFSHRYTKGERGSLACIISIS